MIDVKNYGFTEEQLMLRDTVRKFIKEYVPEEYARKCDQEKKVPWEAFHKAAEMGLLGVVIPEKYGGAGLGFTELGIVLDELSYGYLELATMIYRASVHGAESLLTYGSEEQKDKYLPLIAKGEFRSSLSLTEPNSGSDAASIQVRAVRDGDYFIINGQKIFNSAVNIATRTVLAARTDTSVPKHKGITLFFVDPTTPGIEIQRMDTMVFRALGTYQVFYNDVRIHKDDMLGELNNGWKHLMTNLTKERFAIAAMMTGAARAAVDTAIDYAKQRIQFGQPISKFQVIQHKLADMKMEAHLSHLITYDLANRIDANVPSRMEASMAKIFVTEAYNRIANQGMQILGGYSVTPEFPMERHYRESVLQRIGGGTNEILRNSIAKDLEL
ncbi:acyl-CoA dehydrogenase family protein [Metabacillus arenae]|uniref:Acyl-CoA dehydrogenase family protein n=1 Tax=Metabacillus arenae TaxID=2771434 RepID=A0A926NJ78_9BACI|nr:acyl-CoA dehydrogenase family protein [Metabacillus arenae]MBD1380993.1 acyl-CoA dehydrogenase family protein [Metabacillus arenae]